jgi:hypothetical protein
MWKGQYLVRLADGTAVERWGRSLVTTVAAVLTELDREQGDVVCARQKAVVWDWTSERRSA